MDQTVEIFQKILIVIIILLIISAISIVVYIWLSSDSEYFQRVINTYYILFGGNVIINIAILATLYYILPAALQTIDNINKVIVPALTSGITDSVKSIVSPLAKKVLNLRI